MGFTFDIELYTEQPFIVDLKADSHHSQTVQGAIVIQMDRAEHFKVATVGIHGHGMLLLAIIFIACAFDGMTHFYLTLSVLTNYHL